MTAIRASALRFRLGFLHKWLTWSSNFNSWLIVIHRRTSALLKSIGKLSTIAVVASAQLIVRWLLSLFAYEVVIKSKSSDEPWCCWYLSFFGFLVHFLSPWGYRDVFPFYSVPRDSKKTNLEDTSQSQEINAVVALVPYRHGNVSLKLFSVVWTCGGRWVLSKCHKSYLHDKSFIHSHLISLILFHFLCDLLG